MMSRATSAFERWERDPRWHVGRLIYTTGAFAWSVFGPLPVSAGTLGYRVWLGALLVLYVRVTLNAWRTAVSSTGKGQSG
jgi:hypothetical protein